MSNGFRVDDHGGFARLADDLKTAGHSIPAELASAGEEVGRTAERLVRNHAVSDLPHRGGLNVWFAGKIHGQVRALRDGRASGAHLHFDADGSDLSAANSGVVHHPTYGHRPQVTQSIKPGFVFAAIDELKEPWHEAALAAIDRATSIL